MESLEIFLHTETWLALLSLTVLEIILGVDNILFISILTAKLPRHRQSKARRLGLMFALLFRILFLLAISLIIRSTRPLVTVMGFALSGRDLVLLAGGLFLLYKSTKEIHEKVTGSTPRLAKEPRRVSLTSVVIQIVLLDIVFSFDSILTAIGLTDHVIVMIVAVIISMIIMILFIDTVGDFIIKHPTLQVLGLSFLVMIGTLLIAEAFHYEIPKGYVYFTFFYSFIIEMINMRIRDNKN
ncbi:MAG: TerC family protein [Chlorobi bacterium]|nr:TerC family protein [Chlorobiota bacterium]